MKELYEMNLFMFVLGETICLMTGILLSILPVITRKELLFGVRIPESAQSDPDVIKMRRLYIVRMSVLSALSLIGGALFYWIRPSGSIFLCLYQPLFLLVFQFCLYVPLWRKAISLKKEKNWKVSFIGTSETSAAHSRERLKGLPWGWYILSAILCIIAAAYGWAMYPTLPDTLITHWNAEMQADAWSPKSLSAVFAMPVIAFCMVAFMLGCNIVIYFTKLQVSSENPVLSFAQHREYRRLLSHMLGFITLVIALLFLLMMPMTLNIYIPSAAVMLTAILTATILMIVPSIWLSVKAGQGGNRLKLVLSPREMKEMEQFPSQSVAKTIDRGDDRLWKIGLFYYNKEDPSLFVEDRFGSNGGLNYARVSGKVIAGVIALLTISVYVFTTLLFLSEF